MAIMAGDPLWALNQRIGNTNLPVPREQPQQPDPLAALRQRYGNAPETHDQLAQLNGWNPQPQQPQLNNWGLPMGQPIPGSQVGAPASGGFVNGGGQQLPAPTQQPAPMPTSVAGGGGGDYNSLLQELLTNARSNAGLDGIHDAYNQQSKLAAEAAGLSWTDDMASRGMLPGDNQSRDLRARLVGQAMSPIAANRAAAVADYNTQRDSRLQSIAGMMSEQQNRELERQRQAAADAESKRRFDAELAQNQSRLDYQRTFDSQSRQDELNRLQQAMSGQAPAGGGGGQVAYSGGGGGGERQRGASVAELGPEAEAVRAFMLSGSGGLTREQLLGGGGGASDGGGGGGTKFLPTINAGSNAGLWDDGRGGTTWHNPNNSPKPQQAANSFSGVAAGGGADSFARPGGGSSPTPGAAAPIPGGAQVMGGSQQIGFGGGPANSPSFNTPAGFAGYGQSWNQPQLLGQAAGVKRAQDLQKAAMGRFA